MAKDAMKQAKADQGDLNTAIVVGALIVGWLIYDSVRRIADLFAAAGAVTVSTRVPAQELTVAVGAGAPATINTATLAVADVNAISVASLVLSIALPALCLIGVATLAVLVCRRLMRGVVFDRRNTHMTFAMSMGLLAAGLVGCWFENMGLNGVFAALGGEFDDQWLLFVDEIPLLISAIAVGVLVIVFRRGTALQKDAEGLV